VRTRVREWRLEVDFFEKGMLLRLEGLRLPHGVSFSTNSDYFRDHYPTKIETSALGRRLQGGKEVDEAAVRRFLAKPVNLQQLASLGLRTTEWISIDADSIFLGISTTATARLEAVVDALCGLADQHRRGAPRVPLKVSVPRLTGRRPSRAQLARWPNWRACQDEEDEDGQDESTIRPDDEQSRIGRQTKGTAFSAAYQGGETFPAFGLAPFPEALRKGELDQLVLLERGAGRLVLITSDSWQPARGSPTLTDARLPLRARSVLALPRGGHLELTLGPLGRFSCKKVR
jgi:hypothetical protein